MNAEILSTLLESIEADRLVLFSGAGLSMGAPTCLASAKAIAAECYDSYAKDLAALDPALRDDLEALAESFAQRGSLQTYFLRHLVPWEDFILDRDANEGHRAMADFLLCKACAGALTTNYDAFVESSGLAYGADLKPAVDGDEASATRRDRSAYLKIHGCINREREHTLWTRSQLTNDELLKARIEKSRKWMAAQLREKDLVFIGFWSDWSYLNEVLADVLEDVTPLSVTVVDPQESELLEQKAPALWTLFHSKRIHFRHLTVSGSTFLTELRTAFSRSYLRRALGEGTGSFEDEIGRCPKELLERLIEAPDGASPEVLYDLRRDAEGVPRSRPATRSRPSSSDSLFGLCHLLLRHAGARPDGGEYIFNNQRVRVVNGAGKMLGMMCDEFGKERPSSNAANYVVCAGALPAAGHIVRAPKPGDIVRPGPAGKWLDFKSAREELGF